MPLSLTKTMATSVLYMYIGIWCPPCFLRPSPLDMCGCNGTQTAYTKMFTMASLVSMVGHRSRPALPLRCNRILKSDYQLLDAQDCAGMTYPLGWPMSDRMLSDQIIASPASAKPTWCSVLCCTATLCCAMPVCCVCQWCANTDPWQQCGILYPERSQCNVLYYSPTQFRMFVGTLQLKGLDLKLELPLFLIAFVQTFQSPFSNTIITPVLTGIRLRAEKSTVTYSKVLHSKERERENSK